MKPMIAPLALAALLSTPCLAQAEGMGLYVAPKLGFGSLKGHDMKNIYLDGDESKKYSMGNGSPFGLAIAAGYDFKRLGVPVRAELEYTFLNDVKNTREERYEGVWGTENVKVRSIVGIQTLFVNGYYDFHNSSVFTPYIGLGLGMSSVDMEIKRKTYRSFGSVVSDRERHSYGKKTTTNFAWNLGAGFSYALTNRTALDLGYRFAWIGDGKIKANSFDEDDHFKAKDMYMHQVMLGVRYAF